MTTIKIVELMGVSSKSWKDAAKEAVKEASKTIRNIQGIDVINQTASVEGGEIVSYRVNLKLSFKVEEEHQ
ncbi:dodecin domain-containing protein [Candidatus Bathyarchaeota archaeon]|jgi:dodecin|nr:dodecin domain-containing protein [Candidatus Bathyarchaeota archaeon]